MRMIILGSNLRARVCAAMRGARGRLRARRLRRQRADNSRRRAAAQQRNDVLLGRKGMDPGAPIFVRIFKEESELEVWKARDDGRFYHFKTYPDLQLVGRTSARRRRYGDKQAPEGFYRVTPHADEPELAVLPRLQPRLSERLRPRAGSARATR